MNSSNVNPIYQSPFTSTQPSLLEENLRCNYHDYNGYTQYDGFSIWENHDPVIEKDTCFWKKLSVKDENMDQQLYEYEQLKLSLMIQFGGVLFLSICAFLFILITLYSKKTKYVIVLSGDEGCGKTTAANHIPWTTGLPVRQHSFAEPLKATCVQVIKDIYNVDADIDWFEDQEVKNELLGDPIKIKGQDASPRDVMKWLANNIMRPVLPNVFAQYVVQNIIESECNIHVISDLRFMDEWNTLKYFKHDKYELKLISIRIVRNGSTSSSSYDLNRIPIHHLIQNNGTLGLLDQNLQTILNQYKL